MLHTRARIARAGLFTATFSRKYLAGSIMDSFTSDFAAQCRTASMRRRSSRALMLAIIAVAAYLEVAPAGTAVR